MFDADAYLERMGCGGETGVDIATLRKLHKHHLMAFPYNRFAVADSEIRAVGLDEGAAFETSILGGQGGTCFHLNRLFFRLLGELGYDVSLMGGLTVEGREGFGVEIEHMFNRVALDGDQWIVDVGYPGPSFLEPMLVSDAVQAQYGCKYRLVDRDGEITLQRRGRVSHWSAVYTFEMKARQWADWQELEDRIRELSATMTPEEGQGLLMCSRALENGQVMLKGRRLMVVRDGREEVRTITDNDERRELLSRILSGAFN